MTIVGAVGPPVRHWLRLEGLAISLLALLLYARADYSWWLFAALILLPDVSFAGYLAGARVGATIYNVCHSLVGPLLLAATLLLTGLALAVPLIWLVHIGVDRVVGYGLKYPTAFSDTHLGTIGRRP
jgi:hypothetical protein